MRLTGQPRLGISAGQRLYGSKEVGFHTQALLSFSNSAGITTSVPYKRALLSSPTIAKEAPAVNSFLQPCHASPFRCSLVEFRPIEVWHRARVARLVRAVVVAQHLAGL